MAPDALPDLSYGGFHFAQPAWFFLLLVIPLAFAAFHFFKTGPADHTHLERFADSHLLPHLLRQNEGNGRTRRLPLWLWTALFALCVAGMAGPRWNYTTIKAFRPDRNLIVLLDLSPTMDTKDVMPSRLVRARHEISDVLKAGKGINIGLVAFAAVPHMIAPLTDDMRTINNLLPSIDTSLVTLPGSNLKAALLMAKAMLDGDPHAVKSILLVSDGNFDGDPATLAALVPGIHIYTMGVGTAKGAPLAHNGVWLKDKSGTLLISHLRASRLKELSAKGHGAYIPTDYTDYDTHTLLDDIGRGADKTVTHRNARVWQERFYIPVFIAALLLLPWFRRGFTFPVLLFVLLSATGPQAAHAGILDLFRNNAQKGAQALAVQDYKKAEQLFDTPYRRGVAQYKDRQYARAEKSFAKAPGLDALYNLGNAQLVQDKPEAAIKSYESVLHQRPNDAMAKHNLAIAKALMDKKKKEQQKKNQSEKEGNKQEQQKDSRKERDNPEQAKNKNNKNDSAGESSNKKPVHKPGQQQQQKPQNPQTAQQKKQAQQDGQQKNAAGQDAKSNHTPKGDTGKESPRDKEADQWLNQVQSDPGLFLKNQFMIEDRRAQAASDQNADNGNAALPPNP